MGGVRLVVEQLIQHKHSEAHNERQRLEGGFGGQGAPD